MIRKKSESGYYHVILRGNGLQLIFENDLDRLEFLEIAKASFDEHAVAPIAWCLMGNHVHMVLRDDKGELPKAMHKLEVTYAKRYNLRTGHVGHLFQGAYASFPIDTEAYLLEAVRYVHINPLKDLGIEPCEYRWCSYREYLGEPWICDTSVVLAFFSNPDDFERFLHQSPSLEYRPTARLVIPESESPRIAKEALGGEDPASLKALPKARRNAGVIALKQAGLSVRQIQRLTGIGRGIINACH